MAGRPVETVEIGQDMAGRLVGFCRERGFRRLRVVADANTQAALGRAVLERCRAAGLDVAATVFEESPGADAKALLRLEAAEREEGAGFSPRLPVAVGSGTITDLVRRHASQRERDFISMPTAASVDAYSSAVSALLVDGVKLTLPARAPLAIFVDLDVLASAPRPMTAAGFGDMVCKFSALADWRLGALLWDEPWDAAVAGRMRAAAEACAAAAPAIGRGESGGLATLIRGLLESGAAMAELGHSRPASGAEHHLSHFWEMRLLAEKRPPLLHGLKVGVATVITAGLWQSLAGLDRPALMKRLAAALPPDPVQARDRILRAFGQGGEAVIKAQTAFLELGEEGFSALKSRIAEHWEEMLALSATLRSPEETASLLEAAGCPSSPGELGLDARDLADALGEAHWLRDRFTVLKLSRILGLEAGGAWAGVGGP
jgi:glycerol-1-phosphate dehydrogenase [NAD(P)+]